MSVDCVAVFAQKDTETKSKFNAESEEWTIEKVWCNPYCPLPKDRFRLCGKPRTAKEKTKIILFDTDLINFTDDGLLQSLCLSAER